MQGIFKDYRFGFCARGVFLFAVIMLPNIVWAVFSAPNDVLRVQSATPLADTFASIFQVAMVAALCMLINTRSTKKGLSPLIIASAASAAIYLALWGVYYAGIVCSPVILGLCVVPCLAFMLLSLDRRNYIAMLFACGFTVCHLIFAIVNFLI